MKIKYFWLAAVLIAGWVEIVSAAAATAPSTSLLKAKREAEAKGYIFLTTHDEIENEAKKEGKIRVLSGQDANSLKAIIDAFKKKYPFLDVRGEAIDGTEIYQRMLQEMKAGLARWDVNYIAADFYPEYLSYQKKFDLLGMAQNRVLKIPVDMVDPVNRCVVALQSNIQVVAYNKTLIGADKVPGAWEDFLNPDFRDRKFATDVRPKNFAALVPAWGLEKTVQFAKKLTSQKPVWLRGDAQMVNYLIAGEFPLLLGPNYKTVVRLQPKDVNKVLGYKVVEPIPTRLSQTQAVLATAESPHAALLWLEFQAGAEGQKILDGVDLSASIFSPDSVHEQLTRGKKLSLVAWEHYLNMARYEEEIVKAFGFPRAEKK